MLSCILLKKVQNSGPRQPCFTREHYLLNEETATRYRRFERTRLLCDLIWFRAACEQAYVAIESAKLLFYDERLKNLHDSKQIWKDLRYLGLFSNGSDSPSNFKTEEFNEHFSRVFFDPSSPSVSEYLENLNLPVEYLLYLYQQYLVRNYFM